MNINHCRECSVKGKRKIGHIQGTVCPYKNKKSIQSKKDFRKTNTLKTDALKEWEALHIRNTDHDMHSQEGFMNFIFDHQERGPYIQKYGFAILDEKALQRIIDLEQPIIEVGSGLGYWSAILKDNGVDIIASDKFKIEDNKYHKDGNTKPYLDIINGDAAQMAQEHPDRALMMIWPPYDTPMGYEALNAYEGDTVIYVGEGRGGCTADDDFHNLLSHEWEMIDDIDIPQWKGISDSLMIYKRI